MANLSQKEINEIKAALKEQAEIQAKINSSAGDYLTLIKEIKELNKSIASIQAQQVIQQGKFNKATKDYEEAIEKAKKSGIALTKKEIEELEKKIELEKVSLGIINDELGKIQKTTQALANQAKQVSKTSAIFKSSLTDIKAIGLGIGKAYSWMDGAFKMDKSIKSTALQMGILSKQSQSFADGITNAADNTIEFGVGIDKLSEMQASYSEELGRTVTLSQKGLEAMGQMASATGLGAEGAAKLSADMDNIGMSASRTRDFIQQTMNDSHAMGLNASKVIKNISNNMKMLNKYNFKGGVKGLAKMAETTTKLGVDMNFAAGMADKLFDIEGAVDMSAQLQVLGGAWAKLADPFKLMYMARNDMEALTEELGKAAESSVHFNKANGEFEISALEMQRLRKVAEQTGVSYEELAQAGKNAAKYTKIKSQVDFSMTKETKEFLESTAQFNEKGEATINIDGNDKLLKALSSADKARLEQMVGEKQSLKQRAKDARTFDDTWNNTIMLFKQQMMPLVQSLDTSLKPVINDMVKWLKNGKMLDGIKDFMKGIGDAIQWVGDLGQWLGPKGTLAAIIGGGALFEVAKWYANGLALSAGFNTGASVGGGSSVGGMLGSLTGGLGKTGSLIGGGVGRGAMLAGGLGIAGAGLGAVTDATTDAGSTMNILGKAAADGMTGAAMGSFLGPIGMAIGGAIGAAYGGITAYNSKPDADLFDKPIHDGVIPSMSNDFNKGRGIIQGGQITPIDNKDDLMAYKPNGPIDKNMKNQKPTTMRIEFGDIHFSFDEIKVTAPGSPGIAIDLVKNPEFIRNITRMVHVETNKAISGGVLNPNPKGR